MIQTSEVRMAGWLQTHVVENYSWHAKLCSLRVELPGFEFIAGQFVRLAVETAEGRMQRAYSLVNIGLNLLT